MTRGSESRKTEQEIIGLFSICGLGEVLLPLIPVSGGLMHRMYRVNTAGKSYAVKCLNPEIMKRPAAMANFTRAEQLESIIESTDIPIVPALCFNGRKMQCVNGQFFYIFDWHEGRITDWDHISEKQCEQAGNILGRIHALEPVSGVKTEAEESHIDWETYTQEALAVENEPGSQFSENELARLLAENEGLLRYAERELNEARKQLPGYLCISNEDMDPKNVMWEQDQPYVIDLECLDYGNPAAHALELALQWSGITTCSIDLSNIRAFFAGYLKAYDNGFRGYEKLFGLAYFWVEWLEFNIQRALGECTDEEEQKMGMTEAVQTLHRIRYIHEMETSIRHELSQI